MPMGIDRRRRYRLRPSTIAFQSYPCMTRSTRGWPTIAHHVSLIPSQTCDVAPLALRGPPAAGVAPRRRRLAQPRGLGRCQVLEELPGVLGRPAPLAKARDLQDAAASTRQRDRDEIARPHPPRGLRGLVVDVDLAAVACDRGLAARLEHARRPEPLVHTDRIERALHGETVS